MADAPTGILRKRVAGIPVIYLMGAGVVILAVLAWRMKAAPADASEDVPMEAEQNGGGVDATGTELATGETGYEAFVAQGSITVAPPEKVEVETPEETNATWLKKAVESRVKAGASGGTVQQALQAYLSGAQLSTAQGAERDKAIKEFGLPPDPPETTSTAAPTAAKPVAVPAKAQGPTPRYHKVVNSNDDQYVDIARLYYPTADSTSVLLIANANRGRLVGTGPFKPGTTVYVPKYIVPKYYTATEKTDTASEIGKKNGVSSAAVTALNPGMKFPVKKGTKVRVK